MNPTQAEETLTTKRPELRGEISDRIKSGGRRMTVFGILSIILGIFAILTPAITGLSVVMIVGLFVIAGGVIKMLWAFGAESFGKGGAGG